LLFKINKVTIVLPRSEKEDFYKNKFVPLLTHINSNYSKDIKFLQVNDTMKLEMANKFNSPESVMNFLIKFSKEILEINK